jgi:hypothetical protein
MVDCLIAPGRSPTVCFLYCSAVGHGRGGVTVQEQAIP